MMARRWWCWLCVLTLLLTAACASENASPTELVVTVDSDLTVPEELDRVTLSVVGQETERDPEADLRSHPLPRSVTLTHADGPLGPVQITVRGWLGTALIVESVSQAWFEPGRAVPVAVRLTRACQNVLCASGATCAMGSCVALADGGVGDASTLPEDAAGLDAQARDGAPDAYDSAASDAHVGDDASADASADASTDAGPNDAGIDGSAGDAALDAAAPVDAAADGATAPLDSGVTPLDAGPAPGAAPRCSITTPVSGDTYQIGLNFALLGSCTDPETGGLTAGLRWSSPRDGTLASGASATAVLQNAGNHTLSLCAPDPRDAQLIGCATVAVVASPNPQPSANIVSITQLGSATQPFNTGSAIVFSGAGSGASVTYTWTDDVQGDFGTDPTVSLSAARVGRHTVTLRVRDRYNNERTATRGYVVVAAGETNLVSPLPSVNATLDAAGDPAVAMIASDPALRVYVPNSSGVLYRFDGANLSSAATVAIGQPPLRAVANDAQLDLTHNLTYLATADGLTVCGYGSGSGVVEPCTSYVRGLLPSQDIRSVLRMQESGMGVESLLVGTAQGLLVADTVTGSARGIPLLRGRTIFDLLNVSGRAAIATDRGLYLLTPSTFTPNRVAADTLPTTPLHALALASDGSLWIASESGLVRYTVSNNQVSLYTTAQGLGSNSTRSVAVQAVTLAGVTRDVVWVATGAGVARLDTRSNVITRLTSADGLPSNDVRVVHILVNGTKMFGTARGLAHYLGD